MFSIYDYANIVPFKSLPAGHKMSPMLLKSLFHGGDPRGRFLTWGNSLLPCIGRLMGVPLGDGWYLIQLTSTLQTPPDTPDWTNALVTGLSCSRISHGGLLDYFCFVSKIVHWNVFLKIFQARNKPCSCWIWLYFRSTSTNLKVWTRVYRGCELPWTHLICIK